MVPLYYNLRSLWARRLVTGLTVLGLGLVVFIFASVLMLSHGIERALAAGGSPEDLVVLRPGATAEIVSAVERDAAAAIAAKPEGASGADGRPRPGATAEIVSAVERGAASAIAAMPEVATGPDGLPLAAGELVVLIALPREGGAFVNVTTRGVVPASFAARPAVHVTEGRAPRPGTNEVAIGQGLGARSGLAVGGEIAFARQRWPIVGRLAANGGAYESEVWADRDRLAAAYDRPIFSSVIVRLRAASLAPALARRIKDDPRLALKAVTEDRYWADQAADLATFIRVLGVFVSVVFSIGAILGAMITMYAQVAARTRELGMLRAVGFRRRSVLAGVLVESVALGAASAVVGAAGATAMRFVQISTLNFQTFSEVRFGFAPTPGILLAAVAFGVGMGLLGGLLPALRAARLDILDALRA
jgi:ABC-type lipoprotein release transport system permease subunit